MANRKLNLLFIVNSMRFGGAEKHVVALLNNLDPSQFNCSLVYLKNETSLLEQVDVERMGGELYCANVTKRVDTAAARRIADTVRELEIDIVVCTNMFSLLYGWLARVFALTAPRLVEVFHTTELSTRKDKVQMLFYRILFRLCDKVIYVCDSQRRYWQTKALKVRADAVIHNGIDVDHFVDRYSDEEKSALRRSYGFADDDYVVGLCAALRPEKAHGDLLQALAILRKSGTAAKGLLIGDGPERANIEKQIAALGLADDVKITGFTADVRPVIASCDAMALVSHAVETFSIAALESMALGKPLVISDVGGAREQVIAGQNGYIIERGDVPALARALADLSDASIRHLMGHSARSIVVDRFTLAKMVSSFAETFSGLEKTTRGG